MKRGYLSQYFDGVAIKRLSAVETNTTLSNQHEFNGVAELRALFGEPEERTRFSTTFLYLTDHNDEPAVEDGFLTWYDARQKARVERGVMRREYRLYFSRNRVTQNASEGDLLVIAKLPDDGLLAIVAEKDSTIARQIMWLFDFSEMDSQRFLVRTESELEADRDRIDFATKMVLENIGIEPVEFEPNFLEQILERFGGSFPNTTEFSEYARSTLEGLDSRDDPDAALFAWMDREETLFRTLERHMLTEQLRDFIERGVVDDTDAFMRIAQSAIQRRRSRAGFALENHLEQIFSDYGITFSRERFTEGRMKPDFIFPSISLYHDLTFPSDRLTMLAAKRTCKDRWRQILNEAARIPLKHLVTIEPGISEHQTDEMREEQVQLVIPSPLYSTYSEKQRQWLMDVSDFISLVQSRQAEHT